MLSFGAGRLARAAGLMLLVFMADFDGNGEGGNDLAGEWWRADSFSIEIGVLSWLSGDTERELTGEGMVDVGIFSCLPVF